MAQPRRRRPAADRQGSAYVMILGVSMILTVIGLSAVAVCRINGRMVRSDSGWAESQVLAFSAAEHALARIAEEPEWRSRFAGSPMSVDFGRGTMTWELIDENDGDLADNRADAFAIVARGSVGQAAYALKLRCRPVGEGLDALRTSVHSGGGISLGPKVNLTTAGGPLSTNGRFRTVRKSVVTGDVEAATISGSGSISGEVTVPAPPKALPELAALAMYRDLATSLGRQTTLNRVILSKWSSPFGPPNRDGVYLINAPGRNVTIQDSLIYGTLIVRCRSLTVTGRVLMLNARPDYPALLVAGDLNLSPTGWPTRRSVPWPGPGTHPWAGASGSYYDSISGLTHATGDITLSTNPRTHGPLLAGGTVTCNTSATLRANPALLDAPPLGYSSGGSAITFEGWTRLVE